ncbi:MAG: hypothetical protein KIT18_11675, partial [Burkholderiales bacterium]|nr:hypothetical protein [Burkholderiales bacterium]
AKTVRESGSYGAGSRVNRSATLLEKEPIMKSTSMITAGIVLSISLGLAAASHAQQGPMMGGMGPGMQHGMKGHTQYGATQGRGEGRMSGHPMMNPEEHAAHRQKMRNAATPEERQKIAEATRAEMHKRAHGHGGMPQQRGPRGGTGQSAPAAGAHTH